MIELTEISLTFGSKKIFTKFSYIFQDGKIYCIMGKSGCGKSTLLRIIAGLQKVDSGEALYNGEPIHYANKDIFMMHQKYTNFPWFTILQNVLLPLKINKVKFSAEELSNAEFMLREVGLYDCCELYPHELSGGMNQRVALARVLVANPKVVLMDEPLSALDPATRTKMQNLVLKMHRETGNTIILVTHDPEEANRLADVLIKL